MLAEMYISVRSIPGDGGHSTPAGAPGSGSRRRWLSSTLIGLGLTSLFTDVSSEMVAAVLPLYLTVTLGFTPGMFGLVDGLQQVFTALVRPIGGLVADRRTVRS